jgi:hypothetical protein
MERSDSAQKSKATATSEPKRRGRRKLSVEEARQSIDKMFAKEIRRFIEEGEKAKEKAKEEIVEETD